MHAFCHEAPPHMLGAVGTIYRHSGSRRSHLCVVSNFGEKNWVQRRPCTDDSVQSHSDESHVYQKVYHTARRDAAPPTDQA